MDRKYLEAAAAAATAGAEVIREHGRRLGRVRTKSSGVDFVTEVDIASGVAVVRSLMEAMPGARFVVEEPEVYGLTGGTEGTLDDDEVWIVDPLDGTTSFVHGYPCYSVSVACVRSGRAAAGAVFNAASWELFTAVDGGGAFLDGNPIRTTAAADIPQALLATGFPYERTTTLDRQLRIFAAVIRVAHDIRRDGSAAVDCCEAACGRVDAFWELALRPWDMAAGVCILREAGCAVTDTAGRDWTPHTTDIVAANPALHAKLLELIAEVGAEEG
jgi:myo-inositol-1(or 4)-monophosphatase